MIQADDMLHFWFGCTDGSRSEPRKEWFAKDPQFDDSCRRAFAGAWEAARQGAFDSWQETPRQALALVVLLDQIPRNIFRGDPRSFASDFKALEVARAALAKGFDENLSPLEQVFLYLPFEHAERLEDQDQCLALGDGLPPGALRDRFCDIARKHRAIILRFSRFPHRNRALGRPTTEAEAAFLQGPDSSF